MNWITAVASAGLTATGFYVGYVSGLQNVPPVTTADCEKIAGERVKAYAEYTIMHGDINDCVCGTTQTCSFGPGVVGIQKCYTNATYYNKWSRCEPDPSWRKPNE